MYCINYVIKAGDTLYAISRHYNIALDTLIKANPYVNVYNLQVGEVICVPVSIPQNNFTNFTTYLIEENDTLGSVLEKNGINLADLMDMNELNSIYLVPGTTLQVPLMDSEEWDVTM